MKSALTRLKDIIRNAGNVLAMNQRNLLYIYPHNKRQDYPIANNKLMTKQLLLKQGIPTPATLQVYSWFYELRDLEHDLNKLADFVIKPANGKGGGGILVITHRIDGQWLTAGGRRLQLTDIRKHITDILFGVYSNGLSDQAIIEQRIRQHPALSAISDLGLSDIRIIFFKHQPVQTMLRLPTRHSEGKANLHQGAIGVGIELQSGFTHHAMFKGQPAVIHPDSGVNLIGVEIPHWLEMVEISRKIATYVPLGYFGIDIALSDDGPVVLEINARPGIEIQNVNMKGLRSLLSEIER